MTLFGKGFYMWQIPKCDRGDPAAIAARAASAGLSHVLIKIADGEDWPYNVNRTTGVDLVPPVRDALWAAGIQVWGWHYVRGYDPVGEARLAVDRMKALRLEGYVIDAEIEYQEEGKSPAALTFMRDLRAGLPNIPVALSTYRYPNAHRRVPFTEFLQGCDYAMPQVYFEEAHNPEEQLTWCVQQYAALRPARPVIPTAPAYATTTWRPTADEIRRFLAKAKEMGLTAANAWSYDFSTRPEYLDLWNAVATFDWPPIPPESETADRLIMHLNEHDPGKLAEMYHENAAHVTGARTVVGRQAIGEWYSALFNQLLPAGQFTLTGKSGIDNSRHFTWMATSSNGTVRDGSDTIGLREGKIQYHYTYFTVA